MTLEAWVYPTSVSSAWRDVIYKGNDNYYLEGTSPNSSRPAMGGTFGGNLYGTGALTANTWTHLAASYDGATMRLYVNGVQVASRAQTGSYRNLDESIADRRGQHLRPVFCWGDRRGQDLQPSVERRSDPERHEYPPLAPP